MRRSKIIFALILVSTFLSCFYKEKKSDAVNINIYGSYVKREHIKLLIGNDIVFDKIMDDPYFKERRMIYYASQKGRLKIVFSINERDTSFTYFVGKRNYLKLALSRAYSQFLVTSVDSTEFWNDGID